MIFWQDTESEPEVDPTDTRRQKPMPENWVKNKKKRIRNTEGHPQPKRECHHVDTGSSICSMNEITQEDIECKMK